MTKEHVKVPPIIDWLIAQVELGERFMNDWFQMFGEGDEVMNERIVKAKGLEKHNIGSNEQGSSSRSDQV